uniref:Leucine-, isoleucine-, valine-, threonine-, and alanine-binding protein n=1 Tax=uncultured Thiotrichaceae bacterium TaxID=298394 RepID=A0A6S6TYY3_9GAMM|nr:MAG: Leucine-, isoleucine-, valine-, threonine-, and alanine-binding protein [uncultured Thiotrichaceae bacterium]
MNKLILATAVAMTFAATSTVQAEGISDDTVKIGVMADMGGPYADVCGKGCVAAVEMAVEDFGGKVLDKPIEVISADDQNKPDVGSATAREWVEKDKVDAIAGIVASSVGLAVGKVLSEAKKPMLISTAGSPAFTTKQCTPYNAHWTYDVVALANGTVKPLVAGGKKKWFFITADYEFGHALEGVSTKIINSNGGEVVGSVKVPLGTTDYSSYILQAQASGADAVALANAGKDFTNSLKGASEFGLSEQATMVGLLVFASDVQAIDPEIIGDMRLTTGFYGQMDDQTKAWSKRFKEKFGKTPTMGQAGAYSSVSHYLAAVKEAGTDDGDAVMAKMKANKPDDFFARNAVLRGDGRMSHDMYQVRVKRKDERSSEDDLFEIEKTLSGEEVFLPMNPDCDFNKS